MSDTDNLIKRLNKCYILRLRPNDMKHYEDFVLAEINALYEIVLNIDTTDKKQCIYDIDKAFYDIHTDSPVIIIKTNINKDQLIKIANRSVLIKDIMECWIYNDYINNKEQQNDIDHVLNEILHDNNPLIKQYFQQEHNINLTISCINKKFSNIIQNKYKQLLINHYQMNINQRSVYDNVDQHIKLLLVYYRNHNKFSFNLLQAKHLSCISSDKYGFIRSYYFGKLIFHQTSNPNYTKYSLKQRLCIGPTSTTSDLVFLMVNQAKITSNQLVYDPFVGTGSLLISSAHFGAYCIGTDLDYLLLHGERKKQKGSVIQNFLNYQLPIPDLLIADTAYNLFHNYEIIDAIITDPPYGIRAGARKSGRAKTSKKIAQINQENYIPPSQIYHTEDVMYDLLDKAAKLLKVSGRLVYLLPTLIYFTENDIPKHPLLKLIDISQQILTTDYSRRVISFRKNC